jgi:ApaG protein
MYREVTRGVQIVVEPRYVADQSIPTAGQYFFAYRVQVTNLGEEPVQLLSRHWIITDGTGQVHEVRGPGVVGETPLIRPGESFEYSSYCPLPTPTGNMRGSYQMRTSSGELFQARIPLFFLRDLSRISATPSSRSEEGIPILR